MRRGERLTPEQRAKIVRLHRHDDVPTRILAERFGVTRVVINDVLRQDQGPPKSDSRPPPLESVRNLRGPLRD